MKAIVYTQYGNADVLSLQHVALPTPQPNEVLIKVLATSLNSADWRLMNGQPFMARFVTGLFAPKNPILGTDVVGRIEAVGAQVTQFQVGDEVIGDLSGSRSGTFAEYVCAPETALIKKPNHLSIEEASTLPLAGGTALQALQKAGVKAGQQVLIYGASGGVGTFAVQLAKAMGAHVTATCSTKKVEFVRSLGADHVLDYSKDDFSTHSTRYDVIIAVNGNRSIFEYKRALTPNGKYVMVGGSDKQIFQALLLGGLVSIGSNQTIITLMATPSADNLETLLKFVVEGKVKPVIEQRYRLEQLPEAMRTFGHGHAMGKLVVQVS